ncbi:MAG: DUF4443 domain-containing protein [Candidatus Caldarchaeum sp.]
MESIRKLLFTRQVKGPSPAFTGIQLLYLIFLVGSEPFIGRKRLTQLLGLGEGSVRTMLSRLSRLGYAKSTRSGIVLTDNGKQLHEKLTLIVKSLKKVDFEMPWEAAVNYGVLLRGVADNVSTGVEERDEAVRHGALAAMILAKLSDGLYMPKITNLSVERPEFANTVEAFFQPEVGDVIIITGAGTEHEAKYSALAAAFKLVFGKT